jgi:hypothetical protein
MAWFGSSDADHEFVKSASNMNVPKPADAPFPRRVYNPLYEGASEHSSALGTF